MLVRNLGVPSTPCRAQNGSFRVFLGQPISSNIIPIETRYKQTGSKIQWTLAHKRQSQLHAWCVLGAQGGQSIRLQLGPYPALV